MNDNLTYQPVPFELPVQPPKKGCGCLSIFIGFSVFTIAIFAAIWVILMYSSLPLRYVADLIEKGDTTSNLKITGVSGSLASGLNFKKVTWDSGEIADMRFSYSGIMDIIRRDQLIIYEMHVGSATFNTNDFTDKPQDEKKPPTETSSSTSKSKEPPLRLLRIDRVSLNKIIVKNTATGEVVNIPKIEWTGFKAEKGKPLQFGDLMANSDQLVIKTSNPSNLEYQKRLEITLMPQLDKRILKPINIDALLGEKNDKAVFDIKAFDKTVTFTKGSDGTQHMSAAGVNLTDFIDAPFPNHFHLDATATKSETANSTLTVRSGSFLLGTKAFEIQPTTVMIDKAKPKGIAFLALHRADATEIRYEIPVTESETQEQNMTPILTSKPAMSPEDLMALLYHDRKFTTLAPSDQEKIRKHMTWFSFTK